MANKVTNEDIEKMNKLYYKYKTYAEVARQTGFSPSTVRRYIKPGYTPIDESTFIRFNIIDFPARPNLKAFKGLDNYGELCELSDKELDEIVDLWKEIEI